MLIDNQTRDLVASIDEAAQSKKASDVDLNSKLQQIVLHLRDVCRDSANADRYSSYSMTAAELGTLPMNKDGYVKSIDPLVDEKDFYECWRQYGVVVSPNVVSRQIRNSTVRRIHELMTAISQGKCDLTRPETYGAVPVDANGTPILSRGFFEIYHDDSLAQLRQAIHVYIHHVVIWGTADLWTSFDRYGVKLPGHKESHGLPLHVDQNPVTNPHFNSLQGVLALVDCPNELGTLKVVPGSKKYFADYARMSKMRGEYVELDTADRLAEELTSFAQILPLHAGDLVSWDSRTTHANTPNTSKETRLIAYLSAAPAKEERSDLATVREEAFRTGMARYNHEALLRLTTKPRFTFPDQESVARIREPEQLNLLGQLLYGHRSYRTI